MKTLLGIVLASALIAAPASAAVRAPASSTPAMEQTLPGTAPITSYVNLKDIVAGYGHLLQNPAIVKLLEQLNAVLPDPEHLVAEVGIAGQLHRGVQVGTTFVVRGKISQAKLLAKLAEHGVVLTESAYRGVPLHTGPFKLGLSVQVGLVDEACTLVSFDPSADHPVNKRTIDTLRGTIPSFGDVTTWAPVPHALFSSVMKTEAIADALAQHGIPSGLVKHIELASMAVVPRVFPPKLQVQYALHCDTEENAKRVKTLVKRLHFVLVVLPGFLHGDFHHPFKIVQEGRRVYMVTSL